MLPVTTKQRGYFSRARKVRREAGYHKSFANRENNFSPNRPVGPRDSITGPLPEFAARPSYKLGILRTQPPLPFSIQHYVSCAAITGRAQKEGVSVFFCSVPPVEMRQRGEVCNEHGSLSTLMVGPPEQVQRLGSRPRFRVWLYLREHSRNVRQHRFAGPEPYCSSSSCLKHVAVHAFLRLVFRRTRGVCGDS